MLNSLWHGFVALVGLWLCIVVARDVFESIILPRTVARPFKLTSAFYRVFSAITRSIARRWKATRGPLLAAFGPISTIILLGIWAVGVMTGFAFMHWGMRSRFSSAPANLAECFYVSGTTVFTLGLGDVAPVSPVARAITVVEAGMGLGLLAIVIGYIPVMYQAFSRREAGISALDARAGSPPTACELLRRFIRSGDPNAFLALLLDLEKWCADLMESHISYPVLCAYRSQHDRQSWVASLTAMLDACALLKSGVENDAEWTQPLKWRAHLFFAMARHCVIDLVLVIGNSPRAMEGDRLPADQLAELRGRLAEAGLILASGAEADDRLLQLRRQYEPYVHALAISNVMELPPFMLADNAGDNWEVAAWDAKHFAA
ncbi:MAG: two pore domain potassium channel family protein [Armatimonadetes bacterium]|nr:two pore domain potassium channel family protein [Armatimonadota bacterium]MDE2205722.1 two pore domain potassium channel family protein [Armatimonadota bacterium]